MRRIAPLLLAVLLCGCTGPEQVSPAEFKKQYAWVGKPQTMHQVAYLGQRDGRAYIRIRSMSVVGRKWSEHVIYVELAKLDAPFRDSLPRTEMKGAQ
jgi:outer membrane biogenesis lipoprotein LolB